MSVENFLKEAVDADAINYYLRLLAERQLATEQQEEQIKQLKTQINRINTELNQLTQLNSISTELNQLKLENTIGRFIVDRDGTATDTSTGLMWCRYAIGQQWYNGKVLGNASKMNRDKAMKIADFFNQQYTCGGFFDWRLPTLEELQSIIEKDKSPTINHTVFPNTPREKFWCSYIPEGDNTKTKMWSVCFYSDKDDCESSYNHYAVRLVR